MLTLVPWLGRVVVGTSHSSKIVTPEDTTAARAEIDAFVQETNEAFPALALTRGDITLVHRGLVPAIVDTSGRPDLMSAPSIVDHGREGAPGAMTVIGVKYTTARGVAERTVNLAARVLGQSIRRSTSATTLLPSAGIGDHAGASPSARELSRQACSSKQSPRRIKTTAASGDIGDVPPHMR